MTVLERSRPNTTMGLLNGPNLNLLGFEVDFRQTNHEGVLVDHVRKEFRRTSYLSNIASGVITDCGPSGHEFAVRRLAAAVSPNEIGAARAVAHA